MENLILILLIISNGLFSLCEMALLAVKPSRLSVLSEQGHVNAKIALELNQNPNQVLAATQIGLTFVTLFAGAYAEEKYTRVLLGIFNEYSIEFMYMQQFSTALVLFLVTMVTIVFAEMIPKRAALVYSTSIACFVAPYAKRFIRLAYPGISALTYGAELIAQLFHLQLGSIQAVCAEDIESAIRAGAKSGILNKTEHILLDNVWRLDDQRVGAFMVPKSDIAWIDSTTQKSDNMARLSQKKAGVWLVCKGQIDDPIGFISPAQVVYNLCVDGNGIDWLSNSDPIFGIPNTLSLTQTLEALTENKSRSALVYNEYGQIEGLISLDDMLEGIVGRAGHNQENHALIFKNESGKWLLDGLAPISEAKNALGIDFLPEEEVAQYQTVAGFALFELGKKLGRMPKEFDTFDVGPWTFHVVDVDRKKGYRIDQILVERNDIAKPDDSHEQSGQHPIEDADSTEAKV